MSLTVRISDREFADDVAILDNFTVTVQTTFDWINLYAAKIGLEENKAEKVSSILPLQAARQPFTHCQKIGNA